MYDEAKNKIVRVPEQGKFLKSKLIEGEGEWSTLKVKAPMVVKDIKGIAFNKARYKWRKLKIGDYVIGVINYKGLIELGN